MTFGSLQQASLKMFITLIVALAFIGSVEAASHFAAAADCQAMITGM